MSELLSPDALLESGVFDPRVVAGLLKRCRSGKATGFRENQALVAVLSTQLWWQAFARGAKAEPEVRWARPDVHLRESATIGGNDLNHLAAAHV